MAKRVEVPDLRLLEGVVAPRILRAVRVASDAMTRAKVRHALIGGLAVGAYGYVRATKDVDFLVGEEGYERHGGGIVTFRPGIPILVDGVPIDTLTDEALEEEIDKPRETEGIPIVDPEALVYLKLKAHRRRDKEDIIELLKLGIDDKPIRTYLRKLAPELLDRFEALVEAADEQE
jgi:hypothetical protein